MAVDRIKISRLFIFHHGLTWTISIARITNWNNSTHLKAYYALYYLPLQPNTRQSSTVKPNRSVHPSKNHPPTYLQFPPPSTQTQSLLTQYTHPPTPSHPRLSTRQSTIGHPSTIVNSSDNTPSNKAPTSLPIDPAIPKLQQETWTRWDEQNRPELSLDLVPPKTGTLLGLMFKTSWEEQVERRMGLRITRKMSHV